MGTIDLDVYLIAPLFGGSVCGCVQPIPVISNVSGDCRFYFCVVHCRPETFYTYDDVGTSLMDALSAGVLCTEGEGDGEASSGAACKAWSRGDASTGIDQTGSGFVSVFVV